MPEKPIRVLLIAESANPELTSGALVGWLHSQALRGTFDVRLVTELRNKEAIVKAGVAEEDFTAIDSRKVQHAAWRMAKLMRRGDEYNWSIYTAMTTLVYPLFERKVWKHFEDDLRAGEYDVVHRIVPVTPVAPSPLAKKCAKIGVPFVLGPLNGGVPWPDGFDDMRRRDRDWLNRFRGLHKLMPGYRSTRKHASAIVVASRITSAQFEEQAKRRVFVPENAVDPEKFAPREYLCDDGPVRIAFVGRLVALKGVDMLFEACEDLLGEGKVELDIIGDGPERGRLEAWVKERELGSAVHFPGWIEHSDLQERVKRSSIFAFPSVREFGGGAVLEAMAVGLVPVVIDYGGPGDLVPEGAGIAVPLGDRAQVVEGFRTAITDLVGDREKRRELGDNARAHVLRELTWEAKVAQMGEIYRWVLGRRDDRPDFGTPFPFEGK